MESKEVDKKKSKFGIVILIIFLIILLFGGGYFIYKQIYIEDSSNITVCVAQIDNLKLQVEELERQMAAMKNKVICHACRSQNEIGAVYCTKCGEKISDVIETTEASSAEDDFLDFEE